MWNAIASISRHVVFIQHAVGFDMSCIDILQQGIAELLIVVKLFQDFPAVIGHSSEIDADFGKFFLPLCQLDQLALTEGSPVG